MQGSHLYVPSQAKNGPWVALQCNKPIVFFLGTLDDVKCYAGTAVSNLLEPTVPDSSNPMIKMGTGANFQHKEVPPLNPS